jgi:nucleotidyltransferase substrate binding protein (TIGR01987 family)
METGIKQLVIEEIIELAKKHQIKQVILFGSRARGDYHRTSDIDLAVKGGDAIRFALDTDECTSTLLEYDIVNLNKPVQQSLLQSIKKEGLIIYDDMKKYENYCAALENLKEIFEYEEPYSGLILTGMVALFEICFEQSWKAMKEVLDKCGFTEGKTGSPRQIIKKAYQVEMIADENVWLEALDSRNNVAHAYNQEIAQDIVKQTKEKYYQMFLNLKTEIELNWK